MPANQVAENENGDSNKEPLAKFVCNRSLTVAAQKHY